MNAFLCKSKENFDEICDYGVHHSSMLMNRCTINELCNNVHPASVAIVRPRYLFYINFPHQLFPHISQKLLPRFNGIADDLIKDLFVSCHLQY